MTRMRAQAARFAMGEATFLTRFAASVTVVHRRGQLRVSKIMADRAPANDKIRWVWSSSVVGILGDRTVEGIRLRDTVTGEERDLAVQGLFIAIGNKPHSELVKGQIDLDAEGYVLTRGGTTTRTSRPSVFAAESGDGPALTIGRRPQTPPGAHRVHHARGQADAEHFLCEHRHGVVFSDPRFPKTRNVSVTVSTGSAGRRRSGIQD